MMIAATLAAMAAGISTTTPRTTAATGSTELGARDYLGYRARAPDYVGVQNNNSTHNNSADNNNNWLPLVEEGRAELGVRRGTCSRHAEGEKDHPAERRKPRREQGATLPWGASTTHCTKTHHRVVPRQLEATDSTRGSPLNRSPQKPAPREALRGRHGAHQDTPARHADMLNRHVPEKGAAREEGRGAKPERANPPPVQTTGPPTTKKKRIDREKKGGKKPPRKTKKR